MNLKDLELAGAVLYKCEGTKLRKDKRKENVFYYAVEFTNSEPVLICLFIDFLKKILNVDFSKVKCELFLYEDQNVPLLEEYWSTVTGIPIDQYHKSIVMKSKKGKFKPNPLGTCKIRLNNKEKYLLLNEIISRRLSSEASLIKDEMRFGNVYL